MKNWNTTGKIKAAILGFLFLPNLIAPIKVPQQPLVTILMPFIFGCIAIPLIAKFNAAMGAEIVRPSWNDSLFTLNRPWSFFYFGAYFFLVAGISMVLGTAIKFQTLNSMALTVISFGFGILAGIWFALKSTTRNK